MERETRAGWRVGASPSGARRYDTELVGVSCASARACTAIGNIFSGHPYRIAQIAERWDGTGWSLQRTSAPPAAPFVTLAGVSCPTASMCVAVGSADAAFYDSSGAVPLVETWNGASWTVELPPNPQGTGPSTLLGVSCPSATACIAVGNTLDGAFAEIWDGARWRLTSIPNPPGASSSVLAGVSCTAATSCEAVGQAYDRAMNRIETLAEGWDGAGWTLQGTPNPPVPLGSRLDGVSCTSARACTAVGFVDHPPGTDALALSWDGTSWRDEGAQNPPARNHTLTAVSCTPTATCTAVGDFGAGGNFADRPLAEAWNGAGWTVEATPNPRGSSQTTLNGVSCSMATCVAVGSFYLVAFPNSGAGLVSALVEQG